MNALPDNDALISFLHQEGEHERSELSRRLHDELGGLLTAIKLDAASVKRLMPEQRTDAVNDSLTRLFNSIRGAVDLQRDLVESLRPGMLDHLGLFAALRWQFDSFCAQNELGCRQQVDADDAGIDGETSVVLFRAVQDALHSISDRTAARSVSLRVSRSPAQLIMEIEDDGGAEAGFARANPRLLSLQHRVNALGGSCEFIGTPDSALVRICVPRHDAPVP